MEEPEKKATTATEKLFQKIIKLIHRKKKTEELLVPPTSCEDSSPKGLESSDGSESSEIIEVKPAHSFLSKLPSELLLEIASLLPLPSRVCLALTCKPFLERIDESKALRESIELKLHRKVPKPFNLYRTPFLTPRWELLRLLESEEWRACKECICLHPVSEFPPDKSENLEPGKKNRNCAMGLQGGYLDLCPCRKFTAHDLWRVFRKLSQPGVFQCHHRCSYQYTSAVVESSITATLYGSESLLIETEYYIPPTILPDGLKHVLRFCCRHRRIYNHLADLRTLCAWAHLSPMADDYKRYMACNLCNMSITEVAWEANAHPSVATHCSFKTRMIIAKGTVTEDNKYTPDSTWNNQCLHATKSSNTHRPNHLSDSDARLSWLPTSNAQKVEVGAAILTTPGLQH